MKVKLKKIGSKEQYYISLNPKEIKKLEEEKIYIDKASKWTITLSEKFDIDVNEDKKHIEIGESYLKALKARGSVVESQLDLPKYYFEIEKNIKNKKIKKKA